MSRDSVELVFFEIGGVRYGADLAQVIRVAAAELELDAGRPFGEPLHTTRALEFKPTSGGRAHLLVDRVLGVKPIPVVQLRRMPAAVGPAPLTIGAWLDGEMPVLLVDLHAVSNSKPENAHVH